MKNIITLLIILLICTEARSADKTYENREAARSAFSRMMESAHPTPSLKKRKLLPIPQSAGNVLPYFLNINTITGEENDPNKMQNESSIAVNPKNPLNLIASAVDYRAESSSWVYVSHDGGRTWENINLGKPFPDWRSSNDPSVMFDNDGTGYFVYGGFGTFESQYPVMVGENGVFFARTTDEGRTWKAHIPVILHKGEQTLDSTFEDKYYIQVDNSPKSPWHHDLYVPWKRVSPKDSATQIVIAKSTDRGDTWSAPVNISDRLPGSSEDTTFGQSFPLCTTGPNGEVYVVWNHGPKHSVGFSKSTDGGKTFTTPRYIEEYNRFGITTNIAGQGYRHTVKGVVRAESYPVIQCDISEGPRKGWLYLCWAADPIPNIYFARSTDGGDTWSSPVVAHSDTTNDQFWPWLSIDPLTGDLGMMYLDSRNDKANIMIECFVSYSPDGGTTWKDKRAADISSDLRLNPFTANAFAGDYSGNAFYNGYIYPSWVDMRSAVLNITDSDVYTAIVNVNAPAPPENLKAEIFADEPDKIKLQWDNPAAKSFGQPLSNSDFKLRLLRNGTFLATLDPPAASYTDLGLQPYEQYQYELYAVTLTDSSVSRKALAWSGGSRQPGRPVIAGTEGRDDNSVVLSVKLPSFRLDGVTPLSNLAKLEIFRDGASIKIIDAAKSDTGRTIEVIDNPGESGYYSYAARVIDAAAVPGASPLSDTVTTYTGKYITEIDEKFDNSLPRFLINGGWARTMEFSSSAPYSFTESPNANYASSQNTTFTLFPVNNNFEDISISFMNAAIVDAGDKAYIEYSTDNGITWSSKDKKGSPMLWNKTMFAPWADGSLTPGDWRKETVTINGSAGKTTLVRFHFESNNFRNDVGWFIDDLKLSLGGTSVKNSSGPALVKIYPSPAADWLNICFDGGEIPEISGVEIRDVLGATREPAGRSINSGFASLGVSNLPAGTYFVTIKTTSGEIFTLKAAVSR